MRIKTVSICVDTGAKKMFMKLVANSRDHSDLIFPIGDASMH